MKAHLIFVLFLFTAHVQADCHADNCANHVTGTFGGIGVPKQTRVSLCNDYMRVTVKPAPATVTKTISIYTTHVPVTTDYFQVANISTFTAKPAGNQTITQRSVPTFATGQCPEKGQFSSACACWSSVKPTTTTLKRSTEIVTTSTYLNVACSPAATAVSKKKQFPCSGQWGMCSCLRSGEDDVCVRVGKFGPQYEGSGSGPCEKHKECDVNGKCSDPGSICVYDGSCKCGKRRCYKAAPEGCDYQHLPVKDWDTI